MKKKLPPLSRNLQMAIPNKDFFKDGLVGFSSMDMSWYGISGQITLFHILHVLEWHCGYFKDELVMKGPSVWLSTGTCACILNKEEFSFKMF